MPNISCVCLSDMHLGEEDSVLSHLVAGTSKVDPLIPSPVLEQLVVCIKTILQNNASAEKPILVLNGDILDLALSKVGNAVMVFQRFIELVMPPGEELFSRIVYVPGNHDHHLWESARETQYVNYIAAKSADELLPDPWHTTNMFEKTVPAYMLNKVIQRLPNLKNFNIEIAYPNFALRSMNGKRSVVFSHGHYTESVYRYMSKLHQEIFDSSAVASKVWEIENENFAWIDFIWSTIGRSGAVGEDVESVYEKLCEKEAFEDFLKQVSMNLAKNHDIPYVRSIPFVIKEDELEAKIILWALKKAFGKFALEKHKSETAESNELKSGLHQYLDDSLRQQFSDENQEPAADDVTFVFGHTHKPYTTTYPSTKYTNSVKIHNSGGWVVDTTESEPVHGGGVIVCDSELNTVSLCMYRETDGKYSISIEEPRREGENFSTLYTQLNSRIVKEQEPWSKFSNLVASSIDTRRKNLIERIHSKKTPAAKKEKIPEAVA